MKRLRTLFHAWGVFIALLATATLASAAPAAGDDIRDIRAPVAIAAWWHWSLVIGAAVLSAAVVIALVRLWRKRRAVQLTPLQQARQALLVAQTHAAAGRAHAWAEIVATTVRAALAARLGADVLPQTTAELARSLWTQRSPQSPADPAAPAQPEPVVTDAPIAIELLQTCDLARFALASVDVEALLARTEIAREFVERLMAPAPKPPTPPLRTSTPVMSS